MFGKVKVSQEAGSSSKVSLCKASGYLDQSFVEEHRTFGCCFLVENRRHHHHHHHIYPAS